MSESEEEDIVEGCPSEVSDPGPCSVCGKKNIIFCTFCKKGYVTDGTYSD